MKGQKQSLNKLFTLLLLAINAVADEAVIRAEERNMIIGKMGKLHF